MKRNTEALIAELEPKVASDEDGSLAEIDVTPEQASSDLKRLGELILSRQPEEEKELEEIHQRYIRAASSGRKGHGCLPPAALVSGPLEPVAGPDPLSRLAGTPEGDDLALLIT